MISASDTGALELQVNILDDAMTSLKGTVKELVNVGFTELAGHLKSMLPDLEAELEPLRQQLNEAYDHEMERAEYDYWRDAI